MQDFATAGPIVINRNKLVRISMSDGSAKSFGSMYCRLFLQE